MLLGEIADLVAGQDQLRIPAGRPWSTTTRRGGSLARVSAEYLTGSVTSGLRRPALHVHPNTFRYRIRRAEHVLGMRFDDPADSLLVQLQILRWRRSR